MHSKISLGQCVFKGETHPCLYEKKEVKILKQKDLNLCLDRVQSHHLDKTETSTDLTKIKMLTPASPSKIICLGRNYQDHAVELGNVVPDEPLLFFKPPSSINGPNAPIVYPKQTSNLHYEGELALVLRQRISRMTVDELSQIPQLFGVTCFNDVTARDLQQKDKTWVRGKGFDTFACIGPWIVLDPIKVDYKVQTRLNDQIRQEAWTSVMKFQFLDILAYISNIMTLEIGDVISTGTPAGVGSIEVGDVVEVEISDIGVLRNHIVSSFDS